MFFLRCGSLLNHHMAVVLLLFLICVGGCGDRGVEFRSPRFESAAGLHLVDRLDSAEIWHETRVIDFGTPQARQHLVSGWGKDEGGKAVRSRGVWALGYRSSLDFYLRDARPLGLKLDCWVPAASHMTEQGMAIKVNGRALTRVELQSKPVNKLRVEVPETLLQAGLNRLDFIYDHMNRPCDIDPESRDARPLAVFWRRLVFGGLEKVEAPGAGPDPERKTLTLPFGTQVSFFESLPPGTELSIGGFDSWVRSGSPLGLEILVEADGGPTRRFEIAADPFPESLTFALPESRFPWTKITFRPAGGGGPASGRGGLTLLDPVLVMPAPTTTAAEAEPPSHQGLADRGQVATRSDIIIYLIDCLRADHVGAYGYDRAITPNIDLFASEAVVFENAFAQSSWTRPAVASLLTGIYPQVHGVHGGLDVLSPDLPYLPEIL
ncbi:MAG: sulfatase-like hydrolase/transferase [Thermoanaerobaculales bacterium]|nr:sulfatase-like hydrolase/transferase [Thermoanaerobaculales bacterium]